MHPPSKHVAITGFYLLKDHLLLLSGSGTCAYHFGCHPLQADLSRYVAPCCGSLIATTFYVLGRDERICVWVCTSVVQVVCLVSVASRCRIRWYVGASWMMNTMMGF